MTNERDGSHELELRHRGRASWLVFSAISCAALACGDRVEPHGATSPPTMGSGADPSVDSGSSASARPAPILLDNTTLTDAERREFFHISEGSELFPVDWLLAMRTSSGEKFFIPEEPGYGLLADEASAEWNERGLPVGMSSAPTNVEALQDIPMFGFNCAACHVGEVRAAGRSYRIIGAPNLFDIDAFTRAFAQNLNETIQQPSRRLQFIRDLRSAGSPTLIAEAPDTTRPRAEPPQAIAEFLGSFRPELQAYVSKRLAPGPRFERTEAGFGRADAFGASHNTLLPKEPPWNLTAPVDYPRIWKIAEMRTYHWDGSDTSIVHRNVGQALGLGATIDFATHETSVKFANIQRLEALATKIQPPKWPFTPPDTQLVRRGSELFATHCGSCHAAESGSHDPHVATDDQRLESFSRNLTSGAPFHTALQETLGRIIERACAPLSDGERAAASHCVDEPNAWRAPKQYLARKLSGIWATAPYLHNGAVPTLAALLERERPTHFGLGGRTLDLDNVGYAETSGREPTRMRDTRELGNGNGGHAYGVDLDAADKRALIAYMKTIE